MKELFKTITAVTLGAVFGFYVEGVTYADVTTLWATRLAQSTLGNAIASAATFIGLNTASNDSNLCLGSGNACSTAKSSLVTIYGNAVGGGLYLSQGAQSGAETRSTLVDSFTGGGVGASLYDPNFNAHSNRKINIALSGSMTSGATFNCNTNLIPAGSIVYGVVVYVNTTITGVTSFNIGDGTTANKWGTTIALTSGTQTTSANWLAASANPSFYAAATNVVLTAVGGTFSAGNVRCAVFYEQMTGPNA